MCRSVVGLPQALLFTLIILQPHAEVTPSWQQPSAVDSGQVKSPLPPMQLRDATFQRNTRAGTGRMRDDWLVVFVTEGCGECQKRIDELASDAHNLRDAHIIPAWVDKSNSEGLFERFDIEVIPTTILFSQGKMYRHKAGADLLTFATHDREIAGIAQEVPPDPSSLMRLWKKIRRSFHFGRRKKLKEDISEL
eukprot:gnl/TRDRNA2_/TRDRNA2_210017_c0_seq1.p1 gnl/TRDRNA2_/TRDRNA2_210017_c0~~gnl/TRDRNA2_/TRDRNA2_210017_c0_seq1.p1  ORF type:complete len:212 (+),score=19.19 gnl/TRDRNA2_/TRDRNA2_210017_c0_seq1:59-637(+)